MLEHVAHVTRGLMLPDDEAEQLLALVQRHGQQVTAIEVQQVERVEHQRASGPFLPIAVVG